MNDASTRPRRSRRRDVVALLLSAALATCTDHSTGPAGGGRASLAIRPTFSSPVSIASFGLTIDSLRVRVTRPVDVTVFAQTFFFDPNDDSLQLSLPVQLIASVESLAVHLEFLAGTRVLFAGTDTVVVAVGAPDTTATANVALTYVGPGAGATSIRITPRDSVVTLGGTRQFSVAADSLGTPVDSIYISWSTSNTTLAPITTAGLLQAPNARGSVFVRAVTPDSLRDSTRLTFIPIPATLTPVSGGGQSGVVATRLTLPLRVRVTASDLLGVQGIPVRFLPPVGGSVRDSVVVTDSLGFAEDSVTLGTTTGPQTFQASVTGLTPATFPATANAGTISAAQSTVTVSAGTVTSGTGVTLTLRGKDQFGNDLTTGGAIVAFSTTGGTSTGTIGPTTDQSDGTYTATFTGLTVGTATTIGATVNGTAVTTTLPTITVTAGTISPLTSVVSTSSGTVSSGATATLTLLAKDSAGNSLTTGGAAVVFSRTGGTSTGTIGPTTDHANGTYTAVFTADSAGAATTIRATIGGVLAASTTTITVVPGNTTAAQSVITVSADTIQSGGTSILTLQAKDSAGNNITTGGLTVIFSHAGGTSAGGIAPSPATDNANGTYTATFTGQTAGTATTIHATIDGNQVTSTLPTITVISGGVSAVTSVVTSSDSVLPTGGVATLTLQAKDAAGNAITTGGATVVFTQSGGTSTGAISSTTDHGDGSYTATFTGQTAGTATTIGATINATPVTSAPLPTIRVFSSVHTTDITVDETWTAAASPHIVGANIRIRNAATLTIQAGAMVRFDAGAGLQVGDTTLGEAGRLNIDGGALGILLTANTATPIPGFWRGIEVQRALSGPAWRKTAIEYAGGSRPPFGGVLSEACVLIVNRSGAALDLDSLLIRRCVHAAIHHFGGTAHVHRSQIDTVTGSGIHVDFDAQLELDSTTIRGSGQEGLFFASLTSHLLPSSFNRVLGSSGTGIHLNAFQLPGLLKQDSIVGNGVNFGTNFIEVQGGRPDSTVAAFTIFAQPQPIGSNGYLIRQFGGLLDIGREGGQAVTLDSNLVLRFEGQTGMVIGDSAGTRSGSITSLGSNRVNAPRLTSSRVSPAPGDWYGLEIGRLSANARLANVRIEFAGDSIPGRSRHLFGLLVRNAAAQTLAIDSVIVAQIGRVGSDTNAAGFGVLGAGAGVDIRRSVAEANLGYGFVVSGVTNVKFVGDTARGNTIGFGIFTDVGSFAPSDSVAGNVATANTLYPLELDVAWLPVLHGNTFTGNTRDTLLLNGGVVTFNDTLPRFPGLPWRVRSTIRIDAGGLLTLAPADTLAFDSLAGIIVGEQSPGALAADGSTGRILLTASGPLPKGWQGIDFHLMSGSGSTTNNVFRHVDVDRAGFSVTCGIECSPRQFGALRFTDSLAPTNVNLAITDLIVRRSNSIALDFQRGGTGTVGIANGQFYENKPDPMIRARFGHANQLSITGSDLYHYRGWVIETSYRSSSPADSVSAANNWWGDVLGADTSFLFQDSLGQATTQFEAAVITPFATTPFFPVGPPAGMTTTMDSLLGSAALNGSVGIHARAVDAHGRGVVGQAVNWTPIPASPASFITPASSISDIGGRVDAIWNFTNVAGPMTAHAVGAGGFTDYFIDVAAGLTVPPTAWTLLPALSEGNVSGNTIAFTSTNRRGVLVTNAHDAFGNTTQPFNLCFSTANDPSCGFPYGSVDSVHHGSTAGDTIYFHSTVTQPATFVLRGLYTIATGGQTSDSVVINMFSIPFGVRIDRDEFTPGTQVTPDTLDLIALCPTGQPNFYCQREVLAVVVDSGLAPVANQDAKFQWTLVPAAGAPVSLTTRGTPANDSATVTALFDGSVRLVATDTTSNNFGADTMPILVKQFPGIILVTPPIDSVLVGGTATFTAAAVDLAGDTMPAVAIHWRIDNTVNPHLTIVDTATANQVVVRLDSTPFGSDYVTAFAVRGPNDTLYGNGQVTNPLLKQMQVGLEPWAITANTQTHVVYAGHQFGQLYKIDGTTDAVVDSIAPALTIGALAVNSTTSRLYAATDQGVAVINETNFSTITTVPTGTNSQGVTNRQGLTVDSLGNRIWVTVAPPGASPQHLLRQIDGTNNSFSIANDVSLPDTGAGAAFNPVDGLVYVAIPDSDLVVVVSPATHTIVKRIAVGTTPIFVAVNPVTNRVYALNQGSNDLSVIDAVSGTVVTTVPLFYSVASLAVDVAHNKIYVGVVNLPYLLVVNGVVNFFENILFPSNPSFADSIRGVVVDGAAGNGKIYTSNYGTGTVGRLQF